VFLPVLHYALLSFSQLVAHYIAEQGFDLHMKNDFTFLEIVIKLLRANFQYRCVLSVPQFLSMGFTERKVLMCLDVVRAVRKRHEELLRFKRISERRRGASPARTDRHKTPVRPDTRTQVKQSLDFKNADQQAYRQGSAHERHRSPITERVGAMTGEADALQEKAVRQLTITLGRLLKHVDQLELKMEEFIERTETKLVVMAGKIKTMEISYRGARLQSLTEDIGGLSG
jgi:hypothetical protein